MTQPGDGGNGPANQGGGVTATLFTQEQANGFAAEAKRNAVNSYFKELGFDKPPTGDELKNTLTAASEYQKLQNGQKSDVERLTGELATAKSEAEKVPSLQTQLLRARLAGDSGLKSRYWKYVEGDDEDSIKASVQETLADIRGGDEGSGEGGEPQPDQQQEQQPPAKKGTGSLAPNPQQGAGGGQPPKPSMQSGAAAYKAKRGDKE